VKSGAVAELTVVVGEEPEPERVVVREGCARGWRGRRGRYAELSGRAAERVRLECVETGCSRSCSKGFVRGAVRRLSVRGSKACAILPRYGPNGRACRDDTKGKSPFSFLLVCVCVCCEALSEK